LKTELINLKYKIMKKILFVSAAALALVLSSCKKETPAQVEAPAQVEETVEATAEAAATVENAVLKGLEETLNGIKATAETATAENVPALLEQMKSFKENYEAAKANLNAEEQASIEALANSVVEIIKSKAQ
jgi:hypothetical protein